MMHSIGGAHKGRSTRPHPGQNALQVQTIENTKACITWFCTLRPKDHGLTASNHVEGDSLSPLVLQLCCSYLPL